MEMTKNQRKINWYRCPLPRETLAALNQRSDFWGLLQTLAHLGLLAATGAGAWYAAEHLALPWLLLILFFHGTFYAFLLNGFHELCHSTVFKSKFLNYFFLRVFSFLGAYNHIHFWTSHAEHHKYTLHPPDDLEVVLPAQLRFVDFLKSAIVNPWGLYGRYKTTWRRARGKLEGEWELALFPESDPDKRRRLIRWDRFLLVGHGLIVVVSLYFGLWMVPVLVTLAPFYGGWLLFLVQQHPAHRLAGRRAGLSALHPHGHLESVLPLPLLAHELPHRTPHVRRRAVLPARQATRGHQKRSAALSAGAIRGVDGDRRHPRTAKGRARLRIRTGIAHARRGLRRARRPSC